MGPPPKAAPLVKGVRAIIESDRHSETSDSPSASTESTVATETTSATSVDSAPSKYVFPPHYPQPPPPGLRTPEARAAHFRAHLAIIESNTPEENRRILKALGPYDHDRTIPWESDEDIIADMGKARS